MVVLITKSSIAILVLVLYFSTVAEGGFKRCFKCRSRGEQGDCKDKFKYTNASALEPDSAVEAVPCTSGWCGKVLERGTNTFKDEEYGSATERFCLQRGPEDGEERCAPTTWNHEKVYMCFCQGDLCNSATLSLPSFLALTIPPIFTLFL